MLERALPLLVVLLIGCPAAESPSPKPNATPNAHDERGSTPAPEQAAGSDGEGTAAEPEHVEAIEPVEGLIGSIGFPKHVEFTLANAGTQPLRVVLRGVDHGGSKRTPLAVGEIQWWPSEASEPTTLALDQVLELAPGVVGQLTIYLGTWPQPAIDAGEIDVMSERFRLIGRFRVDEVDTDVTAIARRGTKTAPTR